MIYELRDPAPESSLPKQSSFILNPYPQPKNYLEMNQYSSDYASAMSQGYDQSHFLSSSLLPTMGLPEEQYSMQSQGENAEYVEKEPKCICKQSHNRIPRPRNAFILFRQRYHRLVIDESSESKTNPQVSQELGRRWRALSVKERDHWDNLAEEERQEHAKKYPNYRYTPRRKGKFKHCQVCYGKKESRPARPAKKLLDRTVVLAHQAAAAAKPVALFSLYHYQYQPPQEGVVKVQELQGLQPYVGQQSPQARLGSRLTTAHTPLDGFQYMSFAQTVYPPLNQYGYGDGGYMPAAHTQGNALASMHPTLMSRRNSIFARPATLEYEEPKPAPAASGDGYPLPTLMQQYLVSFNKTSLRKVS